MDLHEYVYGFESDIKYESSTYVHLDNEKYIPILVQTKRDF